VLTRRWVVTMAVALLVSSAGLAAWQGCRPAAQRQGFTIAWSYDTSGQIESCGCSSNLLGGLSRRAALIEQLEARREVLIIEGGHLLEAENSFQLFKGEIIIKALNEMGCDAMLLGAREARQGVSGIKRLEALAEFPLVSANLMLDGEPWGTPAMVLEVAGNRVLLTGVSQPDLAGPDLPAGTGFAAPQGSLDLVLSSFASSATMTVVCLEGDSAWVSEMAQLYFDRADLFLSGDRSLNARELARAAAAESSELSSDWELPNLAFQANPPRLNTWGLGRYLGIVQVTPAARGWAIAGENRGIKQDLVPDERIEAIIDRDYVPQLAEFFADFADELVQDYISPETCGGCHVEEFREFQITAHSRSAESLKSKGRLYDPDCMSCHVVYDRETDRLHSINCIWCHTNIKWNHKWQAMEGFVTAPEKPVARYLPEYCVICHDPLNSLPFERHWPQYMRFIYHGGDLSQAQQEAAALGLDIDEPPPDLTGMPAAQQSQ